MGLFDKLFGKKETAPVNDPVPAPTPVPEPQEAQVVAHPDKAPDNTRLMYRLNNFADNPSQENYAEVFNELSNGDAFLLLSIPDDGSTTQEWKQLDTDTKIELTCVFNVEGMPVLAAFTDEQELFTWAKQPTRYLAMRAQDVFSFCEANNISRLVINSHARTMFVLERQNNFTTTEIQQQEEVMIGYPAKPLPEAMLQFLTTRLSAIPNLEQAYQFYMSRGKEASIVIGFRLSQHTEDTIRAIQMAVQDMLNQHKYEEPIDLMGVGDDWLPTLQSIVGSRFYKK